MFTQLATLFALAATAVAHPAGKASQVGAIQRRGFSCSNPVSGLSLEDCNYLSQIGFIGYGQNPRGDSNIWIGDNGPNVFTFKNTAHTDITLAIWDQSNGYASSFVNANAPKITYSLPVGATVKISMQHGVSGGYSAIYRGETKLSQWGQIDNTWGEFTTGDYATINISREVNMSGNPFVAKVSTGCVADMNSCVFVCKNGANTCGESGSYDLLNCSNYGYYGTDPTGGCQGWSLGSGHIDADFV